MPEDMYHTYKDPNAMKVLNTLVMAFIWFEDSTLWSFWPSSHGYPQGCAELRKGRGPKEFAQGALDHVAHVGLSITA